MGCFPGPRQPVRWLLASGCGGASRWALAARYFWFIRHSPEMPDEPFISSSDSAADVADISDESGEMAPSNSIRNPLGNAWGIARTNARRN
jgi:hypothetical protein